MSGIPAEENFVQHLQDINSSLTDSLAKEKAAQAVFYNKDRQVPATYEPGDLVWLSRRHIKTKRPSSKLDVRRLGPFSVIRMVGKNAAEVALPKVYSRLHPVFNVALLMPYFQSSDQSRSPLDDRQVTHMEAFTSWISGRFILNYRCSSSGVHEYLLRDEGISGLNDKWFILSLISPNLDPFLQELHRLSPSLGPGLSSLVWEHRARLQV